MDVHHLAGPQIDSNKHLICSATCETGIIAAVIHLLGYARQSVGYERNKMGQWQVNGKSDFYAKHPTHNDKMGKRDPFDTVHRTRDLSRRLHITFIPEW